MKTIFVLFALVVACGTQEEERHCTSANAVMINEYACVLVDDNVPVSLEELQIVSDIAAQEFLRHYAVGDDSLQAAYADAPIQITFHQTLDVAGRRYWDDTIDLRWKDSVADTALAHELQHSFARKFLINNEHDNKELFIQGASTHYERFISAENIANSRACDLLSPDEWNGIDENGNHILIKNCYWRIFQIWDCTADDSCPEGFIEQWNAHNLDKYGYQKG